MTPQAKALLGRLIDRYPHCFYPLEGYQMSGSAVWPIKVGIHEDIAAALPDVSPDVIRETLTVYTSSVPYLRGMFSSASRYNLDGWVVGRVTEDEARAAKIRLDAIESNPNGQEEHTMCGGKSVSSSSYVSDPAKEGNIHPVNLSAAGEISVLESLISQSRIVDAVDLLRTRDERNVEHGRTLATSVSPSVPAVIEDRFTKAEIGRALQDILSLIPTKKIEAIKQVRQLTGLGLKEAKDWVEGMAKAVPITNAVALPRRKPDGFLVLARDFDGNSPGYRLVQADDRLDQAVSGVEAELRYNSNMPAREYLVVEVMGRTKPVFSLLDQVA